MSLCDYDVRIYGVEALPVLRARTRWSMTPFFCANNRVRSRWENVGEHERERKYEINCLIGDKLYAFRSAILLVLSFQRAIVNAMER